MKLLALAVLLLAAPLRAAETQGLSGLGLSAFKPADVVSAAGGPLAAIAAGPEDFLARRTLLGDPSGFSRFIRSRGEQDRFLKSRVARMALGTPVLLRVLARPSVARAFAATPAMSDPALVAALARSPLFKKLSRLPQVRAMLDDEAAMRELLTPVTPWLARNAEARRALAAAGPGAARALAALGAGK